MYLNLSEYCEVYVTIDIEALTFLIKKGISQAAIISMLVGILHMVVFFFFNIVYEKVIML